MADRSRFGGANRRGAPRGIREAAVRTTRRSLDRGIALSDSVLVRASTRPSRLARMEARVARPIGELLALARAGARRPAWTLDGTGLRVRVVGPRATADYLAPSLGLSVSDVRGAEPVPLRELGRRGTAWLHSEYDALVAQVPAWFPVRLAGDALAFEIPAYVDMVADVPSDPSFVLEGRGRATKRRIRALERKGLVTALSTEESRFRRFFDEMYEPWIARRFGPSAVRTSLEQCRWWFERGGLLELHDDPAEPAIAAQLIAFVNGTCMIGELGVAPEAMDYVHRTHLLQFLDWTTFVTASERGCRSLNFGGTRARMTDGVFAYKARWKARAVPASRIISKLVIAAGKNSTAARLWIDEMAFLTERDGRLLRVTATGAPPAIDEAVARAAQGVHRL